MRLVRAILTFSIFVGVALNEGSAQMGAAVAEPPSLPRQQSQQPSPGNPYAMGAYQGAPAAGATGAYGAGAQPGAYAQQAPASMPASAADRDRPLGIGDQVTFEIVEDRDAPVAKRVLDTGELDIPYIGRVAAVGRTCDQIAADIKRKLEADLYFKATVRLGLDLVSARSTGRIYLSGLVRAPGPQDLLPGERTTVSAVILKAGGFAQFADDKRVRVTRKGANGASETFSVDVKAILQKGRMELDREVHDGDYINVPQKIINIGM